jgi:hypothetical protein
MHGTVGRYAESTSSTPDGAVHRWVNDLAPVLKSIRTDDSKRYFQEISSSKPRIGRITRIEIIGSFVSNLQLISFLLASFVRFVQFVVTEFLLAYSWFRSSLEIVKPSSWEAGY